MTGQECVCVLPPCPVEPPCECEFDEVRCEITNIQCVGEALVQEPIIGELAPTLPCLQEPCPERCTCTYSDDNCTMTGQACVGIPQYYYELPEAPALVLPADEEPAAEEPAAEEPAAEEPAAEEPAAEEPADEEPADEEPAVAEPAAEDPAVAE